MLKLYDQKSDIRFPLATRTAQEMRAMPAYRVLFEGASVIDVSEEGIVSGFGLLSDYKSRFGITESDPEKALELVIEAQAEAVAAAKARDERESVTMAQLQAENAELKARVEIQDEAILELANLVSEMGA